MSNTVENRRSEIDKLLRQCVDEKLLRGGRQRALELASKAYQLATESPAVPYPWPQLAAYRLAHLLLRSEDSDDKLSEIDFLLELACNVPGNATTSALGPLPYLYRLAVLHRRCLAKTRHKHPPSPELQDAFEQARNAVQRGFTNAEISPSRSPLAHDRGSVQRELFNLLELAAYFLGAEYAPLEGLGAIDVGNLNRDKSWFLVGPDPVISTVQYSRELAMAELEARGREHPGAILIRLLPTGTTEVREAECRMADGDDWQDTNVDGIKLIIVLLQEPGLSKAEVQRKIVGGHDPTSQVRFRQILSRTGVELNGLTGTHERRFFESGRNRLHMARDTLIYGAVHASAFQRRTRT